MKKDKIPYEGRETEEWWWGGKSHPTQRIIERNEDDERLDCSEFDRVRRIRKN